MNFSPDCSGNPFIAIIENNHEMAPVPRNDRLKRTAGIMLKGNKNVLLLKKPIQIYYLFCKFAFYK